MILNTEFKNVNRSVMTYFNVGDMSYQHFTALIEEIHTNPVRIFGLRSRDQNQDSCNRKQKR